MSKIGGGKYRRGHKALDPDQADIHDELAEFQEFRETIAPILREDVRKNTPSKKILEKIMSIAAARLATLAMTEKDPMKALSIIKEVFDRVEGKSKERSESTHKFQNLKPEQIDALLLSEMAALENSTEDEIN